MNPRITPKERGLLKGAIRRVFSRSELRRKVVDAAIIDHHDPERPRVSLWVRCAVCTMPCAKYQAQVDHMDPIIPAHSSLEHMLWGEVVDRTWCPESNLQVICPTCHKAKTKAENAERRKHKKGSK